MRALRIGGIGCQSDAGADIQIEAFLVTERTPAKEVEDTLGDYQGGVFAGLRQQDYKFIATIAKRRINQPQVGLNRESNLTQQFAANQVAVCVIDLLEVIKVNEHHRKLVPESRGAVNLALQHLVEMPRIEQASAIVGDGELLDFFHRL